MNLHIKSVAELTKFLKVLQEGEDPYAQQYKIALEADTETYKLGKGKQPKEDQNEEEEQDVEADPEPEAEQPKDEEEAEEKKPSLDALIRNINNLRSGQSLKSADVRNEVADYYDALSEDEQKVLVLFMRELAEVITQEQTGDEAEKPNTKAKEKPSEEEPAAAEPKKEPESEVSDYRDPAQEAPPIRVNEAQDFSKVNAIYNRLRG